MNSGPLLDPEVEALAGEFVCVRVDSDEREDLVRRWGIRVLPGMLFFSAEGGLLAEKDHGVAAASDILGWMRQARDAREAYRTAEAAAAHAPDDHAAVKALAEVCVKQRRWDRAASEYQRLLALDTPKGRALHARALHLLVYVEMRRERFEAAVSRAAEYETRFPTGRELALSLYYRGLALLRLGRRAEAIATWEGICTRFPGDPAAKTAREALDRAQRE